MAIAKKKNPKLWESCKRQAKAKMGGKHSARAMQLAVACYKKKGGKYEGSKKSSNKLSKWSKQDWGYSMERKAILHIYPRVLGSQRLNLSWRHRMLGRGQQIKLVNLKQSTQKQ